MAGTEALQRESEGLLRRAARWAYVMSRNVVWKLPIIHWPPAAHAAVRLGFLARRFLQLAPPKETLGVVHGHRMWFGPTSECYLDMTQGTWEPGVTHLFETFLEPGMVVVDVGAHIGHFSLIAARRVGSVGKVYAFEPAPENYALLVKNIALNGYRNVIPVPHAVANYEGDARYFLHPDSVAHSLHAETFGKPNGTIDVKVTTLDRFLAAQSWPPVHLVKLDIEGAEPAALEGMAELLRRTPSIHLIVEFIPHILRRAGIEPRKFLHTLRDLRFIVHAVAERGGLQEIDEHLANDPGLRTELWCERRDSRKENRRT
jgi:FkbM family methyltransferase